MDDTAPPSADEATSSSFLVQFVIACMVVTFFVAVLLAYLYIYAKLWSRREDASIVFWRRRASYHGRTTSTATTTRQPGLEPSALPSLPVVFYNPKDFKDGLECAVCLSELSQGEKARILPKCNHGFHVDCIDMWFQSHSTCPLCRTPVISLLNPPSLNPISAHNNNNVAELQEVRTPLPQSDDHVSTNVLFRVDETQVRALAVPFEEGHDVNDTSSTASTSREDHNLVIEIPTTSELCQDCSCSPPPEERSPVMARLRSLKRLLSRGKRAPMAPSPHGPTSGDIEQA